MNPQNGLLITKEKEWFNLANGLNWKSYDPMDLLSSPYLKKIQSFSQFAARVFVQIGIRSGLRLRQLLQIKPHEEAKTLSDFLSAAVVLSKYEQDWAKDYIPSIYQGLKKKAIETSNGWGWGLEFPYSARFVNAPARTPNIYQTINALQAFLNAYEVCKHEEALEYVANGIRFILKDLGVFKFRGLQWFRYFPGRSNPIINVQASFASLLARYGSITEDKVLLGLSDQAAETVMRVQQPEGGWFYSADQRANFIDGFHTGFILQELTGYIHYRNSVNSTQAREVVQNGFDFFQKHLLTSDGLPRYFVDGPVKPDGQNFAQCIQTLVLCATKTEHYKIAFKVWEKMFRIPMWKHARVNYSQNQQFARHYPQLRWTIGPSVLATAYLLTSSYSEDSGLKIA
jgi:hypothetical protein